MGLLIALFVGHFFGDFLCQTDRMATMKGRSWRWLSIHVLAYTGVLAVVALIWAGTVGAAAPFVGVTFLAHMATDAVTSRITSRLWFFRRCDGIWTQAEYTMPRHGRVLVNPFEEVPGLRHWFFVVIGADQCLHLCALVLAAELWLP
ncbi:MAG: DUF3307 domain-containing protein [Vicinamibacterales bacterium]